MGEEKIGTMISVIARLKERAAKRINSEYEDDARKESERLKKKFDEDKEFQKKVEDLNKAVELLGKEAEKLGYSFGSSSYSMKFTARERHEVPESIEKRNQRLKRLETKCFDVETKILIDSATASDELKSLNDALEKI